MKQLASLAWKEWREVQWFFWVAIFVFTVLPCIGAFEAIAVHSEHGFRPVVSPWVYTFGGVLAVFVAAGATCRDFQGRLEDFWRSRPLNIRQWLTVKYSVGLAVVILPCVIALAMETNLSDRNQTEITPIVWLPFFWAALYSVTFLAGCLIRRTAHAAMLGLAVMLLFYTLPILIPPLEWMNTQSVTAVWYDRVSDHWPVLFSDNQLIFGAGMFAIAFAGRSLALLAVKHHWQIQAGHKLMYGAISTAILIMCISAGFRLGTNLPVLAKAQYPADEFPSIIRCEGNSGYMVTRRWDKPTRAEQYFFRTIKLTPSSVTLGEAQKIDKDFLLPPPWPHGRPVGYVALEYDNETDHTWSSELRIIDSRKLPDLRTDQTLQLWGIHSSEPRTPGESSSDLKTWVQGNRLYVLGEKIVTLDITQPWSPRIISIKPYFRGWTRGWFYPETDVAMFSLPQIPELPRDSRLKIVLGEGTYESRNYWSWPLRSGNIRYQPYNNSVSGYRMTDLTDVAATFHKFGQYHPSLIDRVFGNNQYWSAEVQDGLLYASGSGGQGPFNRRIDVFDARDGKSVRLVAHFAAPQLQDKCPLPDGRILAAGNGILWLVGAPPESSASEAGDQP
jgi:hypothetical protein